MVEKYKSLLKFCVEFSNKNTLDIQVFEVFLDVLLVLMCSSPAWQPSGCGSRHLTPHSGEEKWEGERNGREQEEERREREDGKAQKKVG